MLLADPQALRKFAEHEIVIPLVVITELEAKRNHAELGWLARRHRQAARPDYDGKIDCKVLSLSGLMH